jgi:hypothetical protein
VDEGRELVKTGRGAEDYKDWLAQYMKREEKKRIKPLAYFVLPDDNPEAKAICERRAANGLRNALHENGGEGRATK